LGAKIFMQYKKQQRLEEASMVYENLLMAIRQKDIKKVNEDAETITKLFPKTPYASLSALMLARISIEKNNLQEAIEHLQSAIKHAQNTPLEHIARVRLARVYLAEENTTDALNAIQINKIPQGYESLYEEVKGDIYLKQNNIQKAQEAYTDAQKKAPAGVSVAPLQLKQSDLSAQSITNNSNTVEEKK
jgi:predicted negative regulator of RcsB-dependent stress response